MKKILLTVALGVTLSMSGAFASNKPDILEHEMPQEHNWTRHFILKDGKSSITHTPDFVRIGTNTQRVGGILTVTLGSSINGIEIKGEELIISPKMAYDTFVRALVVSNIYEDQPCNWYGEFNCLNGVKITHLPKQILKEENGEIIGGEYFMPGSSFTFDHILTCHLSYDEFVSRLEAAGCL
tara:strand:+ start:1163 stop:1708 length:546 start_codon:yes stop_codon:yes gene_type:complete